MLSSRPRGNLTEELLAQIVAQINSGKLQPGTKLPTEIELVQRHGVSRTVVREAIQRLQAMGLILTRHGIGSFVRELPRKKGLQPVLKEAVAAQDLMAIMELRIGLETEAAALAAVRRTRKDLDNLEQVLKQFDKELHEGEDGTASDFQFHLAIMSATRNRYFTDILTSLGAASIPRSRCRIEGREALQEYLKRVRDEHEDIYNAILREDPDAARAAARNHLSNGRERMRRAAEQLTAKGEFCQ